MALKNIQILLETATRCGGNCSGCALSSFERMADIQLDYSKLEEYKKISLNHFSKYQINDVESATIFLGQGDHFLMDEKDIEPFVKFCSELMPIEFKHKTVIFITASAIGKHDTIKHKMDLFYKYSLIYNVPFFIQVVFDPKKMIDSKKFKPTYLKNILYFKEKCGMTEFTINLGNDLFSNISPIDFHNLIIDYKIKHVEMNLVINNQTLHMWNTHYNEVQLWIKNWLSIYKEDKKYEINFIPFLGRNFLIKNENFNNIKPYIINSLQDNLYVDSMLNQSLGQTGLISNLTPISQRLEKSNTTNVDIVANNIYKKLIRRPSCMECEFKNICAVSGSTTWFDFNKTPIYECPWNIKDFLSFLEQEFFFNTLHNGKTIFNKNPVQNESMIKDSNATNLFFDKQI